MEADHLAELGTEDPAGLCIAEKAQGAGIDEGAPAVAVDADDAFRRRCQDQPLSLTAFVQCRFDLAKPRDVAGRAAKALETPAAGARRRERTP